MNWKFCTYSYIGKEYPQYLGKGILKSNYIDIRYTEKQIFPLECWDLDYVSVFETIKEAIIYIITNTKKPFNEIKSLAFDGCFSDAENVDWNEIELIYGSKGE